MLELHTTIFKILYFELYRVTVIQINCKLTATRHIQTNYTHIENCSHKSF